jgi:aromatic-L-amino-acid decarboxylase
MASALELDGDAFRTLVAAAVDRLAPWLDGMTAAPASWPAGALPPPATSFPAGGAPVEDVLDDLFARMPAGINTAAPGFMGYIPGGGIPHAAVADLIGDIINRYVGISPPAPQLAALERDVIRWFATVIGYPDTAGGTFTSGGSAANLIALAAAREDRFPSAQHGADPGRGVIYISDQAHHSVAKAARFAGLRSAQVRTIASDDAFRMRAPAVADAIAADRNAGLEPFLIVANAGTTNTGAVDELAALADLAGRERIWLHVDAAYGGFFALTARGREMLHGIERADSVVLDPHKTLFLPYGTGALVVREPQRVVRAFSVDAAYLPPRSEGAEVEASELGFELTRPFRGLRVWLPLRVAGVAAFARLLDEKLDLAAELWDAVRRMPHLVPIAGPQLSTLAFAARPHDGEPIETANARTRALLDYVNDSRRVLVTGTMVRGRFIIRPSIVSFRTHAADVGALIELLAAGGGCMPETAAGR